VKYLPSGNQHFKDPPPNTTKVCQMTLGGKCDQIQTHKFHFKLASSREYKL